MIKFLFRVILILIFLFILISLFIVFSDRNRELSSGYSYVDAFQLEGHAGFLIKDGIIMDDYLILDYFEYKKVLYLIGSESNLDEYVCKDGSEGFTYTVSDQLKFVIFSLRDNEKKSFFDGRDFIMEIGNIMDRSPVVDIREYEKKLHKLRSKHIVNKGIPRDCIENN